MIRERNTSKQLCEQARQRFNWFVLYSALILPSYLASLLTIGILTTFLRPH